MLTYTIDVGILKESTSASGKVEKTEDYIKVSPSSVIANSQEMGAVVSIVGDFLESETIPQITDEILLKPNPLTTTDSFQFDFMNYWMLVYRDMITFTGDECNKIGVGYTAFQTQGQR
mmetsp:Transcript_23112/g.20511  ORF Transcript_23112/g.20511 Transcript_23112/m.20511 type:complete len:118 (+) Transcript_23112:619-972(+)